MAHLFENDATLLKLTVTQDGLPVGGTGRESRDMDDVTHANAVGP
jgi:hypothetical protein